MLIEPRGSKDLDHFAYESDCSHTTNSHIAKLAIPCGTLQDRHPYTFLQRPILYHVLRPELGGVGQYMMPLDGAAWLVPCGLSGAKRCGF